MKTRTVKLKSLKSSDMTFLRYTNDLISGNHWHHLHSYVSVLEYMHTHDYELVILEESLFDGYKVILKPEDFLPTYYNMFMNNPQFIPFDFFDKRTLKEYEMPWGISELHNPSSLFRMSNELMDLFSNIPRGNIHSVFEGYNNGDIDNINQHLTSDAGEWPLVIDLAIEDPSKVGFFTPAKIMNMIKSEDAGHVTYFDKELSLYENLLNPELRKRKGIMTTFSRCIEKLIKTNYNSPWTNNEMQAFNDAFILKTVGSGVRMELWDAEEIPEAYLDHNYHENSGTLGHSCMRSDEDQRKVYFYTKLGENIKILVLLNSGSDEIMGRALVWMNCRNRRNKNPFVVMDRVYTTNNVYEMLFHKHAIENGWVRKKVNSYRNNTLVKPNGKGGIGHCFLELPESMRTTDPAGGVYPWLDTFKFYDPELGILTTDKSMGGSLFMQNTNGGYSSPYRWGNYSFRRNELISLLKSKGLSPAVIDIQPQESAC